MTGQLSRFSEAGHDVGKVKLQEWLNNQCYVEDNSVMM